MTVEQWAREKPLEYFMAQYLSHYLKLDVPPFHREMYQAVYDCTVLHNYHRLLMEAPRSFAKSTISSIGTPLYHICVGDNTQMISVTRDIKLSRHWLSKVKRELEQNEGLRHDFGIVPGDVWSKDHIKYKRGDGLEGEFFAMSKGMSARGWRPQLAIIDDPQNSDDVRSETVRAADWEWFTEDFIGVLEDQTPLVFIGTRLHPLCMLAQASQLFDWHTLSYKALTPDGKSIWPQKWPVEALDTRRKEIGDVAFASEYMNEPIISENPIFRKDWIQWYEQDSAIFRKEQGEGLYTITYIDPAISKRQTADWTAIVTVSATPEKKPRRYVRECKRGHWSIREAVDEAFLTHEKYHQRKTKAEANGFQLAIGQEIQEEERIRGRRIGGMPIKNDRDKVRRGHSVTPEIQEGLVFFDQNDPMQQKLVDEMILFPTGNHDDMVDALIGCLEDIQTENLGRQTYDGPIIVRARDLQDQKRVIQPLIIRGSGQKVARGAIVNADW